MSRIPNEGLKLFFIDWHFLLSAGLNEQNPERGIETLLLLSDMHTGSRCLNEQNPERGIETK